MLKALRNKTTQKQIYIVIAVAVVATFALSGIILTTEKEKKSSNSLGILHGHNISVQEYLASYRAVERQFQWMLGDKIGEMKKFLNIKGEAWDRILLLDYAKKENLKVSDKEVVGWITSQPSFQSDGQFDKRAYKMYVEQVFRADARQFEEEIRQLLTVKKVRESVQAKISVGDVELKKLYTEVNRQRDIQYGLLPMDEKVDGQKTVEDALKKMDEIKKKIQNGDLETTLKNEGLVLKTIEKLSKDSPAGDLGNPGSVLQFLNDVKEGQISDAFPVTGGVALAKVLKDYPVDDKKFEADKEKFKEQVLDQKSSDEMRTLLNKLRNNLKTNLEIMKELFPVEEK